MANSSNRARKSNSVGIVRRPNHNSEFLLKLKDQLKVLFQFDCADLDFGIYRIMNYKRKEIEKFIEDDLIGLVEKEFERYKVQSEKELRDKIEKIENKIKEDFGSDILRNGKLIEKYGETKIVKEYFELKRQIDEIDITESIQAQVFNDLYNFFSRYYEDGDFISKRRYSSKQNKYAIPYSGEEVKLYWANFDQYYIKTGEVFKDYEFNQKGWKFIFRTVFADVPAGNVKGNRRYFFLSPDEPVNISNKACLIKFEYRPLNEEDLKKYPVKTKDDKEKTTGITQDDLNAILKDKILEAINHIEPKAILNNKVDDEKTILEKHLYRFTRKITSDFFIHKDLKGFLERELDYFIKTEVLDIESLDTEKERYFDRHITRAKVVRNIGSRIIEFLSQIENFQKYLWEKKKFVLKTDYVITLDRIPEDFYKEVLENKEQLKEWEELGFDYSPLLKGCQTKSDGVLKLPYNPALKEKARELRKAGNLSEVLLWNELKNKKMLGCDFTRQQVIGNYIVDFHCPKLNLVIEIDGESHNFKGDYDEQRDNYLKSLGLTVLHFNDLDIKKSLNDVLIQIEDWIKENTPSANADTPFGKRGIKLPVDTKYFSEDFKERLLEKLGERGNIDDLLDGILIKSENWQALNLLLEKYKWRIKCIYIDPPFNSKSTEIIYKNFYKHSSWLSLIENRLLLAKQFLEKKGVFICAIDENEQERLGLLIKSIFNENEYLATLITILHNPSGIQGENFSVTNEYAYFIYPNMGGIIYPEQRTDENADVRQFMNTAKGRTKNYLRESGPNCFYPILVKDLKIIGFGDIVPLDVHPKNSNILRQNGIIEIYPIDDDGVERKWVFARNTVESILDELTVRFNEKKKKYEIIRSKKLINYKTVWFDSKYSAKTYGTNLLNALGINRFSFPKSLYNVLECIKATTLTDYNSTILDFFAGSGTTNHAVMKLNKEDGGKRKYILVEIADYFDTVIIPRIKKICYSFNWKDGKPLDTDGIGQFFKYHYLEQYEDTLHNIEFPQEEKAQKLLGLFSEEAKTEYLMKYMLKFETEGSPSLLNLSAFENPYEYKLKIISGEIPRQTSSDTPFRKGKGEETVNVDLVETFNYLIGLKINRYKFVYDNTPSANADTPLREGNGRKYTFVFGERNNRKTAIIWRLTKDIDLKRDKEIIDKELGKFNPDEIFVNGDSFAKGYKPIESEFKTLMGV